ncbi:MAG: restriction endonuclease subunit S [Nitrospira sp.]|nr:restriction endonuclease subunit S [Nitrospira sp.]
MQKSPSEKTKLPHGWRQVALEKIASVISGQSPTSDTYRKEPEGLPFFQGKAGFGQVSPTARVWCVAPKTIAKPGDILISVRAPVGPTNVADVECCIGRGLAAIRCGNSVERDFVLFFMKFHEHEISQMGTGSTFGAISRKHLLNIQIPLPSLPEQKRVVAVLNKQMAAVEVARGAALERVEAARALPSAWLREVFSFGGGGLPRGWQWVALGNVADYVNGKAFKPAEWQSSGLPIVRIQNLNNDSASYNYYSGNVQDRYLIKDGDLLVSWSASLDAFIWNRGDAILNQHIFKVVENPSLVERKFLYFSIKNAMDTIKNQVHGATMQHITKPAFESVKIPLPPLTEQKRLISSLNAKMATTEKIRVAAEAELEAITALPAALLREAFSGAL